MEGGKLCDAFFSLVGGRNEKQSSCRKGEKKDESIVRGLETVE